MAQEDYEEGTSALGMSDEDILNMPDPEEAELPVTEEEDEDVLLDDSGSEQQPETEGSETDTEDNLEEELDDGLQEEEQTSTEEEVNADPAEASPEGEEVGSEETDTDDESGKTPQIPASTINYEAEYNRLLAPFKANGRQMQVTGVDDALTLMQMGANYNKKMAGLKPNLRLLKMLEKNDLLDESRINNLIDLSKQNPAAIQDLLQKSGIDPIDLDVDAESEYVPETYTVDDKEVDLDGVLEDIQDTPTFNKTIDIISNKWDGPSKQVLLENPSLIKVINEHVESGIYSSIHEIVENERALGRLTEMSDIQAYKHVGDVIQANGGFAQSAPQGQQPAPQPQANAQPAPAKAKNNPKLKSRKRAAGSPKGSPGGQPQEFNPLSMSDEEFEKATAGMLL